MQTKQFLWTLECKGTWELIKQKYIQTPILISLNWDVKFHVHAHASMLAIGVIGNGQAQLTNKFIVNFITSKLDHENLKI